MTVTVNPPKQLRIPVKFREDRELRGYFDQVHQILFQLSQRTGGGTDIIEAATDGLREIDEARYSAQRTIDLEYAIGAYDDSFQPSVIETDIHTDKTNDAQRITDIEGLINNEIFSRTTKAEINPVSTAIDYTTIANDLVICSNALAATVTLNASPEDLETVTVKRTDAQVTVDGNSKNIDGSATVVMATAYESLVMVYVLQLDGWSIVSSV